MVRHRICRNLLSSQTFTVKGMSSSVDSAFAQSYRGYRNRLGLEKSPYLLQHASNPVDWYHFAKVLKYQTLKSFFVHCACL